MVRILTLGIIGTVLGVLAGIYNFAIAYFELFTTQQATMGLTASYFYITGIVAIVFSFIGMGGALLGERGLPSFLLSLQYSYLVREKTIALVLLIIGAIGVFFTSSLIGLPTAILFVIAGVKTWRRKDEIESEQETGEGEQEIDTYTY
jgi:hypothetical protein